MTKDIKQKITDFISKKNEIQALSDEGEDFDYSIPMEMMDEAVEIFQQLQDEIVSLKKCYEITNQSWQEIKEENEKLKQFLIKRGYSYKI